MNEEINEDEYIENKFSNEDLDSSKNISSLNNVINKNEDGTYTIDPDKISILEEDIYLTDKQIGAIVNEIFKKEMKKNGRLIIYRYWIGKDKSLFLQSFTN